MKNRIWIVPAIFLLLVLIAVEALAAVFVIRLNIRTDKQLISMFVMLLLLTALIASLLFFRCKKSKLPVLRITGCIMLLLSICGSLYLAKIAFKTSQTLHEVTQPEEQTGVRDLYIFVRGDDPAQSVKDTGEYAYGILDAYEEENTRQAIMLVESELDTNLSVTAFAQTDQLADALLNGQIDAVFMNGAAITLLTENDVYADFLERVRILHTIPISQLEVTGPPTEPLTEPPVVQNNITNTPFIVYLSGSDTRNEKLKTSRSDVNILAVVNPNTKQVLLLNTPRDYWISNPAGKGKKDKLAHCGLYGPDCSMQALEELYNLNVDYYAQINFTGFETLVDAVGGITVHSDRAYSITKEFQIKEGNNHLNGKEALLFARDRYKVAGGDNGRGKNQMQILSAIIRKLTSGATIIANYASILDSLEGTFKTTISAQDMSLLVKMQQGDMASWNIQSFAVTGKDGSEKNYSAPGQKAYVIYPNEKMVAYASALAERVMAGEILTEEDLNYK